MLFDRPCAIVDLETTGGHITRDRITEVGVILIDGAQVERFDMLVNPGQPIPPFIEQITGISNAMVADAAPFVAIAEDLQAKLQGRLLIAHNVRFDYGFLKNEFKRLGMAFRSEVLCSVKLSRLLYPQYFKHSLESIIARHGINQTERHRALADADALYQFLQLAIAEHGQQAVEAQATVLMAQPATPPGMDPEVMERLPDVPGVYLFYGDDRLPLYVARSSNLRHSVLAHFSIEPRKSKAIRINEAIRDVEWVETIGEFGGQLQELQLVRTHKPLHNLRGRLSQELCSLQLKMRDNGFLSPCVVYASEVDFSRPDSLYGLFRSQKEAKKIMAELCEGNGLCQTSMALEPRGARKGACFAHQLGRCKGACVGREDAESHNRRLQLALERLKVKSWPYPGAVAVRETDPVSGEWEEHVFERWCYLGSRRNAEAPLAGQARFDVDTYKLLSSFIRQPTDNAELIVLA